MPETKDVAPNGASTPPAEASIMQTGLFNARGVVQTLERLMNEVTKDDCTPATVNAAANCAAKSLTCCACTSKPNACRLPDAGRCRRDTMSVELTLFTALCNVGNALAFLRDTQEPCSDNWRA